MGYTEQEKLSVMNIAFSMCAASNGSLWYENATDTQFEIQKSDCSYVGTVTDITERKQAEDVIFKEKLLSETIINNLQEYFISMMNQENFKME
jgi:hypothetical protein